MLEGSRIAVVVPSYNEARWIGETVSTMPAYVDDILIIDDASADDTAGVASSLGDPRVTVVRHPENRGVGAAIATGYREARALGAHVVAVMAGDGQMHPDDLLAVALPVVRRQHDYVKGNRLGHPAVLHTMPLGRLAAGHVLGWLTGVAIGRPGLTDSQCGFTAISTSALEALDLSAMWPRYGYPNDLLGAIARAGLSIGEVPVRPVYRGEASGVRVWHVGTVAFLLARAAVRRALPARRAGERERESARLVGGRLPV
ncbi:MAG: glycosyltransferase family 2 protein [Polyangiaceae bacterium]